MSDAGCENSVAAWPVERDQAVTPEEVEALRASVGWEPQDCYESVLKNYYANFTVRDNGQLVGMTSVISDGILDALIVGVVVHPSQQKRGLGRALVRHVISAMKADGIRYAQIVFRPELTDFYRRCGINNIRVGANVDMALWNA